MHYIYSSLAWIGLSLLVAILGKNRKMGFWGYFFASLLLTPIIGLLLVFASSPQNRD